MNFRKSSKGGGVIFNPKIYVADFCHYRLYFGHEFQKKICNITFRKCFFSENEGRGVRGRLELFRKFIRFGRGRRPLSRPLLTPQSFFCFGQRTIFIDNITHCFRDQSDLIWRPSVANYNEHSRAFLGLQIFWRRWGANLNPIFFAFSLHWNSRLQ